MTSADAIVNAEREIDLLIDRYLVALERRIRLDLAATGPENQDALDRPPDPGSWWSRLTVEEVLIGERVRLTAWRDRTVATVRDRNHFAPSASIDSPI